LQACANGEPELAFFVPVKQWLKPRSKIGIAFQSRGDAGHLREVSIGPKPLGFRRTLRTNFLAAQLNERLTEIRPNHFEALSAPSLAI
jgi:hypothetical protein